MTVPDYDIISRLEKIVQANKEYKHISVKFSEPPDYQSQNFDASTLPLRPSRQGFNDSGFLDSTVGKTDDLYDDGNRKSRHHSGYSGGATSPTQS